MKIDGAILPLSIEAHAGAMIPHFVDFRKCAFSTSTYTVWLAAGVNSCHPTAGYMSDHQCLPGQAHVAVTSNRWLVRNAEGDVKAFPPVKASCTRNGAPLLRPEGLGKPFCGSIITTKSILIRPRRCPPPCRSPEARRAPRWCRCPAKP